MKVCVVMILSWTSDIWHVSTFCQRLFQTVNSGKRNWYGKCFFRGVYTLLHSSKLTDQTSGTWCGWTDLSCNQGMSGTHASSKMELLIFVFWYDVPRIASCDGNATAIASASRWAPRKINGCTQCKTLGGRETTKNTYFEASEPFRNRTDICIFQLPIFGWIREPCDPRNHKKCSG